MSKEIENHFALKEICRKATSYFVGSFMLELIKRRSEWENPETKTAFIRDFHNEYFGWDDEWGLERTRNRVNCVIRIIESRRVEDALQYVIDANEIKMDIAQAKVNAQRTLDMLNAGELKY